MKDVSKAILAWPQRLPPWASLLKTQTRLSASASAGTPPKKKSIERQRFSLTQWNPHPIARKAEWVPLASPVNCLLLEVES